MDQETRGSIKARQHPEKRRRPRQCSRRGSHGHMHVGGCCGVCRRQPPTARRCKLCVRTPKVSVVILQVERTHAARRGGRRRYIVSIVAGTLGTHTCCCWLAESACVREIWGACAGVLPSGTVAACMECGVRLRGDRCPVTNAIVGGRVCFRRNFTASHAPSQPPSHHSARVRPADGHFAACSTTYTLLQTYTQC
jgi:hypothetical protein